MNYLLRKAIKLYVLLPIGIIVSFFKRDRRYASILMYHRVNDNIKKELAVTTKNFEWQMDYLKKKNYNVITLDTLIEKIKTKSVPKKCVVLTFDDGYEDYYHSAYKTLKRLEFPSIQYLVPGYIEKNKTFWWDRDIGESKLMNWEQINELSKSELVTFGAHTINHPDLDRLNNLEIHQELQGSKKLLEAKLKKEIKHFCYPRGRYNTTSKQIVRKTFESGVLMFNGKEINSKLNKDHLCVLKREPIQQSDGKLLFIARLNGWLCVEDNIKKIVYKMKDKAGA
ncbi:hypothetical protein CIB95_10465 [Lottiidibacillus patelloidae]|uniref:NodB homology domain-containing protein n=1 Tax=Lottiidibacillus patelloidae TaxID=2670334 RepID=A0A263BSG6_9BACI|nr:polysaccharide deacetylase family protein [Lottiidibacillus patelloidae]OZM56639.1 hypothetical protein CIB95_10465 [Lottiidibacillus patelloidae]